MIDGVRERFWRYRQVKCLLRPRLSFDRLHFPVCQIYPPKLCDFVLLYSTEVMESVVNCLRSTALSRYLPPLLAE